MVNDNVNSDAPRSREKKRWNSGGPNVVVLVGISFGLLCVLQSILNITLRLQSERDLPFQDKDLPPQEMKEKIRQLSDDVERLRGEKDFLLQSCEGSGLLLTCPEEWLMSQSGCYQFSSTKNTWFHAKQDCEQKGAHLVIFNDQEEERYVGLFTAFESWIGLSAERRPFIQSAWKWVDGSKPTSQKWNGDVSNGKRCVLLQNDLLTNWVQDDCSSLHNWICEREQITKALAI